MGVARMLDSMEFSLAFEPPDIVSWPPLKIVAEFLSRIRQSMRKTDVVVVPATYQVAIRDLDHGDQFIGQRLESLVEVHHSNVRSVADESLLWTVVPDDQLLVRIILGDERSDRLFEKSSRVRWAVERRA